MSAVDEFRQLHHENKLLHIGNAWNAQSALAFENAGYTAIGTSSAAIADTFGWDDGEQMNFEDLLLVVGSMAKKISVPLTVDIESGYSREANKIAENIIQLIELGVVGVNLEDSLVDKNGQRSIVNSDEFSATIKKIRKTLEAQDQDIFLNIRTDPFLLGLDKPVEETISRARKYESAGADGLFVPCVFDEEDITPIVEAVSIPVNVMAMPNLPSFTRLQNIGVKRVSLGSFAYEKHKASFGNIVRNIELEESFNSLFQ